MCVYVNLAFKQVCYFNSVLCEDFSVFGNDILPSCFRLWAHYSADVKSEFILKVIVLSKYCL